MIKFSKAYIRELEIQELEKQIDKEVEKYD
jgi:hypothetical protein